MAGNGSSWRVVDRMGCAVSYHDPTEGASRRHLVSGVPRAYPATLVMVERRRYRKRPDRAVIAVQIDLDTPGFTYHKWGGEQRCKAGDWLVDNDGDVYTVDRESFARTYRQVGPGRWLKTSAVWAEVATSAGTLSTKEGGTHYEPGDYLVFNEPHGGDPYAVSRERFEGLYEPAE